MISQQLPETTPHSATPSADREPAKPSRVAQQAQPGKDLLEEGKRLQQLIEQAETLRDPVARALVHECLQSILAFYGDGLERILQVVQDAGPDGREVFDRLVNDSVVRGLLLIHGLHPLSLEARLHQAMDKVRPYMESHGGNVELVSLQDDFARLRLQGTCKGCPSSSATMELALRRAIEEACPDLLGFEVEGVVESAPDNKNSHNAGLAERGTSSAWTVLGGMEQLQNGHATTVEASGVPVIIARVNGHLYAYRNLCPACGMPLEAGRLENGQLHCRLGHRFNVQQAGRDAEASELHLDPFPLLVEEGVARVAAR